MPYRVSKPKYIYLYRRDRTDATILYIQHTVQYYGVAREIEHPTLRINNHHHQSPSAAIDCSSSLHAVSKTNSQSCHCAVPPPPDSPYSCIISVTGVASATGRSHQRQIDAASLLVDPGRIGAPLASAPLSLRLDILALLRATAGADPSVGDRAAARDPLARREIVRRRHRTFLAG